MARIFAFGLVLVACAWLASCDSQLGTNLLPTAPDPAFSQMVLIPNDTKYILAVREYYTRIHAVLIPTAGN